MSRELTRQIRQIRRTIGMLNSMIKSGESHSEKSEKMVESSNNALDAIKQCKQRDTLKDEKNKSIWERIKGKLNI